jgi:hypothetical protein
MIKTILPALVLGLTVIASAATVSTAARQCSGSSGKPRKPTLDDGRHRR